MADMVLDRPGQGQVTRIPSPAAGSRYKIILNFNADAAEIDRKDDSLIFKFEDGSVVELEKFYSEFSKENLPQFQIEDRLVAGMEFFKTFAPDIAPAAGLGNSARGGRFSDLAADNDLMDGLSRLESLDKSVDYLSAFMPEAQGRLLSSGEASFSPSGALPPLAPPRGSEVFSLAEGLNLKTNIRTGDGDDTITIGDLNTYKAGDSIQTRVNIDAGAGNDTIHIGNMFTWGDVESFPDTAQLNITSESGDNTITTGQIVTVTDMPAFASTELAVETGNGDDVITIGPDVQAPPPGEGYRAVEALAGLAGTSSSGSLDINAGDGGNTITVNGLAALAYSGAEAAVSALINTGSGDDTINVTDVISAQETALAGASVDLHIDAGNGNNSIAVGTINLNGGGYYSGSYWQGGLFVGEITTGNGDDRISVGDIMQNGRDWSMDIAAGGGDDTVALSNAGFGAGLVVLDGGAGLDTLNLDEAGSFSMSAFLANATVTNFEVLDLRDVTSVKTGEARVNNLTFDLASLNGPDDDQLGGDLGSLFAAGVLFAEGLDGKTGLVIHLDAGDGITFSNNWSSGSTITGADNTQYQVYTNTDNAGEYVLVGAPPVQPQGAFLPLSAGFAADVFADAGDVSLFGGMDMAFPVGADGQPRLYGDGGELHDAGLDALLAGITDAPVTLDGLLDQASGAEAAAQAQADAISQNLADMRADMADGSQPVPYLGENHWRYSGTPENVAPENLLGGVTVVADTGMAEIEAATNDIMVKHSAA